MYSRATAEKSGKNKNWCEDGVGDDQILIVDVQENSNIPIRPTTSPFQWRRFVIYKSYVSKTDVNTVGIYVAVLVS